MSTAQSANVTNPASPSPAADANNAPREVDVRMQQAKQQGRRVRTIPTGGFYTLAYDENRVNFEYDTDGKVTREWVG